MRSATPLVAAIALVLCMAAPANAGSIGFTITTTVEHAHNLRADVTVTNNGDEPAFAVCLATPRNQTAVRGSDLHIGVRDRASVGRSFGGLNESTLQRRTRNKNDFDRPCISSRIDVDDSGRERIDDLLVAGRIEAGATLPSVTGDARDALGAEETHRREKRA